MASPCASGPASEPQGVSLLPHPAFSTFPEWLRGEGPFQTLFDVFEDDTEDHVLPDTLYRVFVLFDLLPRLEAVLQDGAVEAECYGASPQSGEELGGPYAAEVDAWRHSRVWDALRSKLQPRRGKGTKAQQQFEADCARYSLFHGSHPTMKAVRVRLRPAPEGAPCADLISPCPRCPASRPSVAWLPSRDVRRPSED